MSTLSEVSSMKDTNADEQTEKANELPENEFTKKIEELENQLKEQEKKYLYLYAEFENFKKRSIKERSDLIKFGWEGLAHELLQTVDNLERAMAHLPATAEKNWTDGIQMVLNLLKSTLQKNGVVTIETLHQVFDPNLHEAVGQENSSLPSGTITQEQMRGYTLHGRLLRPARVVISNGTGTSQAS